MGIERVNYGELIAEILRNDDWQFSAKQVDDLTVFKLPMAAKNCPGFNVSFIVNDIGDVKLRCYLAEDTAQSKRGKLLEVVNDLNGRYRYITVSLDDDGDILAAYDFTIFSKDVDDMKLAVCGTTVLFAKVADNCIPSIMKALWSED